MQRNLLWVHWIPTHDPNPYLDYIRKLQPGGVKIINPDVEHISRVFQASPNSLIMLRQHSLSEEKSEMYADPVNTANRHVQWWLDRIDEIYRQAAERNLPMPPRSQLILLGINEPEVWDHLQETVIYYTHFLDLLTVNHYVGGALSLNVGWPANTGTDTPPDWGPYEPVHKAIAKGNHYLVLHEYWGYRGPMAMWGWHAGRFTQCPWHDVKIIAGECGVDNHVDDGKGNRGWKHGMSAEEYANQVNLYITRASADNRFVGGALFTDDYGSPDWETFNNLEAHPQLLAKNWTFVQDDINNIKLLLPFIGNFPIVQKFGEHDVDYTPYNGHMGIDFATPTGTKILATDDGTVSEVNDLYPYGKYVKIIHNWGESVYFHLDSQAVQVNQSVKGGELIGYSDNTGRSSGPHLHFGIRINPYNRNDGWDGYSDPLPYLNISDNGGDKPEVVIGSGVWVINVESQEDADKIIKALSEFSITANKSSYYTVTLS